MNNALYSLWEKTKQDPFRKFQAEAKEFFNKDLITTEDLTPQLEQMAKCGDSATRLVLKMDSDNKTDFNYFCYLFWVTLPSPLAICLVDTSGYVHDGPLIYSTLANIEGRTVNYFNEMYPILESVFLRETRQDLIDTLSGLSYLRHLQRYFKSFSESAQDRIISIFTDGNFIRQSIER